VNISLFVDYINKSVTHLNHCIFT